MEYTQALAIPSYLCDIADRLHPWAAVRLCQEVSEYHTNELHIGFPDLLKQGKAWVLSRAYYEFRRRPAAFEKVQLSTWSRGNDGLFAFRDYEMRDEAGEVLICGTSYWPIIDMQSRRVVRLHDILAGFPQVERAASQKTVLGRLRAEDLAADAPALVVSVQYSMLDHTRHVNNAEYNKWIFDAVSSTGFDLDQPFSIELNYNLETKPQDSARVYLKQCGPSLASQIANSQGTAVVAQVNRMLP